DVSIEPQWRGDAASLANAAGVNVGVQSNGTFVAEAVPAGSYVLSAVTYLPDPPAPKTNTDIVVQTPMNAGTWTVNLSDQPAPPPSLPADPIWSAQIPLVVGADDIEGLP